MGEIAVSDTIPYSSAFTMVPDSEDQLIERYEDVQVANALSMDKRLKSWLPQLATCSTVLRGMDL